MNPRYVETFRRHRALFLLPLALGMALALWATLGAPKMYQSNASLWSDSAAASANEALGAQPPAAQDQSMLNELLTTRYFQSSVARRSPLRGYVSVHPSEGWGPTALIAKLRASPTIDDRVASALGPKRVTSVVKGPHVLEISYEAPSPALALGTLKVIVEEFRKERAVLRRDALTTAREQVVGASKALNDARTTLGVYLREHPGTSGTDPQLSALTDAERQAVTQLANATDTLNQATTAVLNGATAQTTLRVVDRPRLPTAATTGKKRLLVSAFAGLFGGGMISILGIVALTALGGAGRAGAAEVREAEAPGAANGSHPVVQDDGEGSAGQLGEQSAPPEASRVE